MENSSVDESTSRARMVEDVVILTVLVLVMERLHVLTVRARARGGGGGAERHDTRVSNIHT